MLKCKAFGTLDYLVQQRSVVFVRKKAIRTESHHHHGIGEGVYYDNAASRSNNYGAIGSGASSNQGYNGRIGSGAYTHHPDGTIGSGAYAAHHNNNNGIGSGAQVGYDGSIGSGAYSQHHAWSSNNYKNYDDTIGYGARSHHHSGGVWTGGHGSHHYNEGGLGQTFNNMN
uniref:Glycine-rich cell wall structural protein 1.8-like n=1 Tax=Syphacia muris TaxID=451379 RepID=A0A0N5AYP7_9BILA